MLAPFVRPFWMRYRRFAGGIVLQTRSNNAQHFSRSCRRRQLRILPGKHYKSRVLPYQVGQGDKYVVRGSVSWLV